MNPAQFSRWLFAPLSISPQARGWLQNRGSLTRLLQLRCKDFHVEPVFQSLATASEDELAVLGLRPRELAHVREVYLYCGKIPVVF
ncbi:MAG: chorismate lyase, partial [Nitrosomonadaceae bacterium]|nr:chorismate lyase [Nitrosomonadaceae bacterium]